MHNLPDVIFFQEHSFQVPLMPSQMPVHRRFVTVTSRKRVVLLLLSNAQKEGKNQPSQNRGQGAESTKNQPSPKKGARGRAPQKQPSQNRGQGAEPPKTNQIKKLQPCLKQPQEFLPSFFQKSDTPFFFAQLSFFVKRKLVPGTGALTGIISCSKNSILLTCHLRFSTL